MKESQNKGYIILEKKDVAEVKPLNNSGTRERNKKKRYSSKYR